MKRSIFIFMTLIVLSVGMIVYGCVFVDSRIGEATLTEEQVAGNREAADGLAVGFRADSAEELHWINRYDYSTHQAESSFRRGKMTKKTDSVVYDEIRFTGWSTTPYVIQLKYDRLEGLQQKEIHAYYERIQQKVKEKGTVETGKIRLKDYLDYYPISFRFQFGTKIYHAGNALTGLKIYDEQGGLSAESGASYDDEVALYTSFNNMFRIPVIENEYQEYEVSSLEDYDPKTSLGYKTDIEKPLGPGEDVYEFDPIIVIQQENIMDGGEWFHPDLSYEGDDEADVSRGTAKASDYNLKNRMLFVVNNRTARGEPVDVSQIGDGFGVYELPIDVTATATVRKSKRNWALPSPKPLIDEMKMTYPLDEDAEYVEMSLSGDHRYLAVFSVKDGDFFVEMIDADRWTSDGPVALFPASEKMTYTWGEDGSLAVTNHAGYLAVLARREGEGRPFEILYSGKVEEGLDHALFTMEMIDKKNSRARYQYGIDSGLTVVTKDGKAALVQNLLAGDRPESDIRNAALECAVIDESGVIYRGRLKNNIVDLEYDMNRHELQQMEDLLDGDGSKADSDMVKYMIQPVGTENWSSW